MPERAEPYLWAPWDSNPEPKDYESSALTVAPGAPCVFKTHKSPSSLMARHRSSKAFHVGSNPAWGNKDKDKARRHAMARPIDDITNGHEIGHCKACGYADTLEDGYCDMCVPGSEIPQPPEPPADTHQWSRYEAGMPDFDGTGYTPLEESSASTSTLGFDVNAWLKANRYKRKVAMGWDGAGKIGLEEVNLIPPIKCQSGLKFYIRADRSHACRPRDDEGPYTLLELFIKPSDLPNLPEEHRKALSQYFNKLHGTYGYVPVELVEKIVDENGGPA